MTQALGCLQGCGVVHRNLRLESWQLTSGGSFPLLKLSGLSHSTRWHKKEGRLNAACGMLAYTSPGLSFEASGDSASCTAYLRHTYRRMGP